jgi:hypothetical protein
MIDIIVFSLDFSEGGNSSGGDSFIFFDERLVVESNGPFDGIVSLGLFVNGAGMGIR